MTVINTKNPDGPRRRSRACHDDAVRRDERTSPETKPQLRYQPDATNMNHTQSYWDQINSQFKQALDSTYTALTTASATISGVAEEAGIATARATRFATGLTKEHPFSQFFSKINPQQSHSPTQTPDEDESDIFDRYLEDNHYPTKGTHIFGQSDCQPDPTPSSELETGFIGAEYPLPAMDDHSVTGETDTSANTDSTDSSLPNLLDLTPTTTAAQEEMCTSLPHDIKTCEEKDEETRKKTSDHQRCSSAELNSSSTNLDALGTTLSEDTPKRSNKNKTCPIIGPHRSQDDSIYRYASQTNPIDMAPRNKIALNIVHDIGYCAPAALGLILIGLLNKKQLSSELHHRPLGLILRLFRAHYGLEFSSSDELLEYLSNRDIHTLQWIMSPILRLVLLCILQTKSVKTSDVFFERNDKNDTDSRIEKNPFLDIDAFDSVLDIDDHDIQVCVNHMSDANKTGNLHAEYSAACWDKPFSTDDLFLVCRSLLIQLKLHCVVETSPTTTCKDLKDLICSQIDSRTAQQSEFYALFSSSASASIHYQAYIFDDSNGIMGHFDCIDGDATLNAPCWSSEQRTQLNLDELRDKARLAHNNGRALIKQLTPPVIASIEPETKCPSIESPDYNNGFEDINLGLNLENLNNVHTNAPNTLLDQDMTDSEKKEDQPVQSHCPKCELGGSTSAFNRISSAL